jgi:hypothetical protein
VLSAGVIGAITPAAAPGHDLPTTLTIGIT